MTSRNSPAGVSDLKRPSLPERDRDADVKTKADGLKTRPDDSMLRGHLEVLSSVFPDCDPSYIENRLDWHAAHRGDDDEEDSLTYICDELKMQRYPLRKKQVERNPVTAFLTVHDFRRAYRHPVKTFYDIEGDVSDSYKAHALVELRNSYRQIKVGVIDDTFKKYNFHYAPTDRELNDIWTSYQLSAADEKLKEIGKTFRVTNRPIEKFPMMNCELFSHERWFVKNQQAIKDYLANREARLRDAVSSGASITCQICSAEVLPDEFVSCVNGHEFCRGCFFYDVAQLAVENGKFRVDCLDAVYTSECSTADASLFTPESLRTTLERRRAEYEMGLAELDGLENCPHCSYAPVIMDKEDKVFRCLNPRCLKETCRLCGAPNHVPLHCDEIETSSSEATMRKYIEQRMSGATIRSCDQCGRRFVKHRGCSEVKCTCGNIMRYACRQRLAHPDYYWCVFIVK